MIPFKLEGVTPNGKPAHVWACGKCQRTCIDEEHAQQCCAPDVCKTCGGESRAYHTFCDECRRLAEVAKEQERYEKAEKIAVAAYDHDMVCMPNGDYVTLDDALDQVDDEFGSAWAWACSEVVPHFDAENLLESLCEELSENAYEQFDGAKLQKLLDAYVAEEWKGARCYESDWSRVVILKEDTADGT